MPCLNKITCKTSDGCIMHLPSKCVTYDGPATTNIGYITNMSLTDLLVLIDNAVGSPVSSGSYINSSPTVAVTGLGSQSNPYILSVKISTNTGNNLTTGSDGALFVAPPTPSDSGFNI